MKTCNSCYTLNRNIACYCKECGAAMADFIDPALRGMIGKKNIVSQLMDIVADYKNCKKKGMRYRPEMDMLILGPSGTGKTYLAHIIHQLFLKHGIISKKEIIWIDASSFDQMIEELSETENEAFNDSLLFVDNVHYLMDESIAMPAIERLFGIMEKWESKSTRSWNSYPIVVLAGEQHGVESYFEKRKRGRNRFENLFRLQDFTAEELTELCTNKLQEADYEITPEASRKLNGFFKEQVRTRVVEFRNGNEAIEKANDILKKCRNQSDKQVIEEADIEGTIFVEKSPDELFAALNDFAGMISVKKEVKSWIQQVKQYRKKQNDENAVLPFKNHYIFVGNPGTGKTTVARLFADLLHALHILPGGQLIEVTKEDLTDPFMGGTGPKTRRVIDSAMGGVLFIDEAYSLAQGSESDPGKEAINALLKPLEDRKGEFVCIIAGYTANMQEFIDVNPGLASRFDKTLTFEDYKPKELESIFLSLCRKSGFALTEKAKERLPKFFEKMYLTRSRNFGNAREVVTHYRNTLDRHREHLEQADLEENNCFTAEDIEGREINKESDPDLLLKSLDKEFTGMQSVKKFIREIAILKKDMDERLELNIQTKQILKLNILLTGNPGTGKTTIARKLGELFYQLKILPYPEVIEKERKDIIGVYVNSGGAEMEKVCNLAMGRTLFIDEAYSFAPQNEMGHKDQEAAKAVEVLMKRMEDDAGKFAVILAGYQTPMDNFIRLNEGISRRITYRIHIDDYSVDELLTIFLQHAERQDFQVSDETKTVLIRKISEMYEAKDQSWGNAGEMIKLLEQVKARLSARILKVPKAEKTTALYKQILPEDIPFDKPKKLSPQEILQSLNELVGLTNIKHHLSELIASFESEELRARKGGKTIKREVPHYVFTGNPGTGKTTVARMMADIFTAMGIISRGQLVQATEKDLIAGAVGQTAIKTSQVIDRALGGVLFIDEAYSLHKGSGGGANFGQEAINTLLERLSGDKGKFVCILSGYTREMNEFLNTNPGLSRRFRIIEFEDFTPDELHTIFCNLLKKEQLIPDPIAAKELPAFFSHLYNTRSTSSFGNAGEITNIFKQAKERQGMRLKEKLINNTCTDEELKTICMTDITGVRSDSFPSVSELTAPYKSLIGTEKAKKTMETVFKQIYLNRKRASVAGNPFINPETNFVLLGHPNTGQTEFLQVLLNSFLQLQLIKNTTPVYLDLAVLCSEYMYKGTNYLNSVFENNRDSLMIIHALPALCKSPVGRDFSNTWVSIRKTKQQTGIIALTASADAWNETRNIFPEFTGLFKTQLIFDPYSASELKKLFLHHLEKNNFTITQKAADALGPYFEKHSSKGFDEITSLFDAVIYNLNCRLIAGDSFSDDMLLRIEISDIPLPE